MTNSFYKISLDIHEHGSHVSLKAKKGDTGRLLYITLMDGGKPYAITNECRAVFTAKKADGNILYNHCSIIGNVIAYAFTPQTTSAAGKAECEIKLYGADDKLLTSARFTLMVEDTVYNEGDEVESEKEFASAVATGIGDAYSSGLLDKAGAEKMLMEYADKDEEEAASKVSYWDFIEVYPQYKSVYTEAQVEKYHEFAEPADISVDVYAQFINGTKGLETIKDEWGDVEVTKREQVLEVIDSLDLTWQQKDALYLAAGYSESKIWDVPW